MDHGVIICPPIHFEQIHSHRSLRHLADALARQGLPTLRFDWHGSGDSAGNDEDADRLAAWRGNVRDAIRWLREQVGCRRVSVIGLRMGALLAAEALSDRQAAADECDNFVLWAPVTSGQSLVRQMQAIEKMAESQVRLPGAAAGDVEAAGFVLGEETIASLAQAKLQSTQPRCRRMLLVGPCDKRVGDRFTSLGIPVDQVDGPGFAEMMLEPHFSQVPWQAIGQITSWLGKHAAVSPADNFDVAALGPSQTQFAYRQRVSPSAPAQAIQERAVRIDGDVELFGIVTECEHTTDALPTILLINSGSVHRVGPGRLYVDLARHLALQGFRCVRLDGRGLGDSVLADVAEENNPYAATVFRDVELTLQALREQYAISGCVVMGLCSGAYAAFQSAVQLDDPLLVESVLINPLTFFWKDGMSLDMPSREQTAKEHRYLICAVNPKKLWSFLTFQTDIGYRGAVRVLSRRLVRRVKSLAAKKPSSQVAANRAALGHPIHEDLPGDLARLGAAGRRLAMFISENDPGYSIINHHARRDVKRMLQADILYQAPIRNADHTFTRRAPRFELIRALGDYLRDRYGRSN